MSSDFLSTLTAYLSTLDLGPLVAQFVVGLSRSMILFLVASGLTLILGVLRIINFAHGSLYMIGAYLGASVFSGLGKGSLGFWLALLFAPLGVALLGLFMERWLLRFIYGREHLLQALLTFAVMLILADIVKLIWGVKERFMSTPLFLSGSLSLFGVPLIHYNVFLIVVGFLIAFALWFFVDKTRTGKTSRAVATDREMVAALGINAGAVGAIIFGIGSWLAGLGGTLIAPTVTIAQGMDVGLIIETFLVVIIGGMGNMWGAFLGSLIIGITHSYGVFFWSQFSIVFPYLTAAVLLIVRPSGLLKSTW
jgi:branched-chain amino acid transport system permease protein